jgi:hypothetical protein
VTPEERSLIMSLVFVPGRGRTGSPEEVLRHFGTADGQALGLMLLRDAAERQDPVDVEMALIVGGTFGVSIDYLDLLARLLPADWHHSHEDIVTMLGKLRAPDAVDALYQATQWVPDYLDFDDSRALATKSIWALGGTSGPEAEQALVRLLDSDSEIVRTGAEEQLERRKKV